MDISTICIHGSDNRKDPTGSITVPIYQSATFAHPGVGMSTGYDYSRVQNPTREMLEKLMTDLEGGADALAFSTGMAAIAAMMELFQMRDHIIALNDLYGGSVRLFHTISKKNGLTFTFTDMSDPIQLESLIKPETKAIFVETPSNPMMHVADLAAVSKIAHRHNLLLIVDNTFLTPYYQNPIALGADIVVHSGTKYLSGHNDTLAGFIVVKTTDLADKLRAIYKTTGSCLSPFDSWLIIRGIKTLSMRMDRQQSNAISLARWLSNHRKVKKVYYIGMPDHPNYAISIKQARGFGAMISFEVDCEETAINLLERMKLVLYAESLGGVETLITYPKLQTHADVPVKEREALGINDRLLRLSVGAENIQDLIDDFEQALS